MKAKALMTTEQLPISSIKINPNNPRIIKDDNFNKLVQSIKNFPEMLQIRPIVVNDDLIVLGGNMRLKACKEAGLKDIPVIKASKLTLEQQREFIIKDNIGFGDWDWQMIAAQWNDAPLDDWGLNVPNFDVSESIIDIENIEDDYIVKPEIDDDNYSVFELVMNYNNKIKLLATINKVKDFNKLETIEEALMEIIDYYKTSKKI